MSGYEIKWKSERYLDFSAGEKKREVDPRVRAPRLFEKALMNGHPYGAPVFSADRLASLATEEVLQHAIDGQLDGALRQRTGATYGVAVSLERLRGGTATLKIRTSVANEHLDASLAELHRWFIGDGVSLTDQDVELAKFGALVSHSLAVETTHDLAKLLFDYARWGISPTNLADHSRHIAAVETARVNTLLATCRGSALVLGIGDERRIRGAWAMLR